MGLLFFEYEHKSLRVQVRRATDGLNDQPSNYTRLAIKLRNRHSTMSLFDFRASTKWRWDMTLEILVSDCIVVEWFLTKNEQMSALIYSRLL